MISFETSINWKKSQIKINNIPEKLEPVVFAELQDTAVRIRNHMIRSMDRTPRSGAVYKRGGKMDRRSLPGKAPAPDTGTLKRSIKMSVNKAALLVEVGSNLRRQGKSKKPYSVYLEEGTRKMKPRPYLEPAIASATRHMGDRIVRAIKRATR